MRGLAGLDRVLDCRQRPWRKNPPRPPAVLEKMPADAPDAHSTSSYQLPDAPPPPKLPPPPPLSPEPLLLLPPQEPPEYEPPPDQPRPLPRPEEEVGISANMVKRKAMIAAMKDAASDPAISHASAPTMPPVATAPISLPSVVRRIVLTIKTANNVNGLSRSIWFRKLEPCSRRGAAAGKLSPSTTRMIRSTPAEIPPAKSPLLKRGVMISSMMRFEVTSVSAPSRP